MTRLFANSSKDSWFACFFHRFLCFSCSCHPKLLLSAFSLGVGRLSSFAGEALCWDQKLPWFPGGIRRVVQVCAWPLAIQRFFQGTGPTRQELQCFWKLDPPFLDHLDEKLVWNFQGVHNDLGSSGSCHDRCHVCNCPQESCNQTNLTTQLW